MLSLLTLLFTIRNYYYHFIISIINTILMMMSIIIITDSSLCVLLWQKRVPERPSFLVHLLGGLGLGFRVFSVQG